MEKLSLMEVSSFCHGRLTNADAGRNIFVSRVTTDSRDVKEGDLFVALKGERFNGHDFVSELGARKAAAAMVDEKEMNGRKSSVPMIFVDDTVKGFQSLARKYRERLSSTRTVAVAGSNGKTGTKEMVAAVLGTKFSVLKNEGNLNNHIGVPMSLMRLERSHEVGVLEIGTNHPGELVPLLEMIQPLAGVVTTIGEEHMEFFKDLAGVTQEEGTVADYIPAEGLLALNADDTWSDQIAKRARCRVVYFGLSSRANFRAEKVAVDRSGTRFTLVTPQSSREIKLKLLGRHQVSNALAAAVIGNFFGLSLDQIASGLEQVKPAKMRMEPYQLANGVSVIHDAYNANPSSMRAALDTFQELESKGRKIAVLGEMRELGDTSVSSHREIGTYAAKAGLDLLFVVGTAAKPLMESFVAAPHGATRVEFFQDTKTASEVLRKELRSDDLLLLKASRGMALETILENLK